jgi:hypothetical protein
MNTDKNDKDGRLAAGVVSGLFRSVWFCALPSVSVFEFYIR